MEAEKVHEEIRGLKEQLGDIHRAVVGDPKFGAEGLVKRVAKLEKGQVKLLLKTSAMAGGIGGAVAGVAKWLEHFAK